MNDLDIFLVICPPWGVDVPPLGIASLSAYLRKKGFKTEIFDFNIYLYNRIDPRYRYLWDMGNALSWRDKESFARLKDICDDEIDYCAAKIVSVSAGIVGFSVLSNSQDNITAEIVRRIKDKRPDLKIVLGGASISVPEQRVFFEDESRRGEIDAFIIGEGEEALCRAIEAYKKDQDFSGNGLTVNGGKGSICLSCLPRDNFNDFPFPTFQEFDLGAYRNKGRSLIMEWSRGCVARCSFCAFKDNSCRFVKRNPSFILRAISYYKNNYQAESFFLVDSAVNCDLKHIGEICDLLILSGLKVRFSALAIPKGMDEQFLSKMRDAGFVRLEYGAESGSDKILKAMHKLFDSQEAEAVIKATHKAGIETVIYLIVGHPGETDMEFHQTLDFLRRNSSSIDFVKSVNPLYLMAGSFIYKNHKKFNIVFPDKNPDFRWSIGSENTYEIRLERVNKIRGLLGELGIPYFKRDNQFETGTELLGNKDEASLNGKLSLVLATMPPWGIENPPVGLGYLSSYIRSKNIKSKVFDFNIYFYNTAEDAYKRLWHVENKNYWSGEKTFPLICELFKEQINYAVEEILSCDSDLIGFSVVDPKERLTVEVIRRIRRKAPGRKIILGGPACSTQEQRNFFVENLQGGIDYFVVGEGEETLYEIAEREKAGLEAVDVSGLAIKDDEGWRYAPRRSVSHLDSIPFPTYDGFDLNQYGGGKSLLVEWSRGCLGRCGFCKNYSLVSGYHSRTFGSILKELEFWSKGYEITEFTVCDNIMNGDIKQLSGVCDGIIKKNLDIKWSGQIAPRREMDYDLFCKIRKSGCHKIQIGVESGSDKVLRSMKKIYTTEIARENIKQAKRAGMEVEIFIMVGFPGEGKKEFEETCRFIKDNSGYVDAIKSINTLHLIAGTDVYENYRKYNLKPLPQKDWHYLWEAYDGNNYKVRKERAQRLLALSYDLGLKVLEINVSEGKEGSFFDIPEKSLAEQLEKLKIDVNRLQGLPQKRAALRYPKKRPLSKVIILSSIFILTLFYMTYFWIFRKIRGKALLGGE